MTPQDQKNQQRNRFYMMLPVLVLPFLVFIFWMLGGGQGVSAETQTPVHAGLNLTLPQAHFSGSETWNKLTLYEEADRDSMKYRKVKSTDPYYNIQTLTQVDAGAQDPVKTKEPRSTLNLSLDDQPKPEARVEEVNKKLEQLYKAINTPASPPAVRTEKQPAQATPDPQFTEDVDRLESMMEMLATPGEVDPEMQQLESVLDKILDVQHPERVAQRLKSKTQQTQGRVYTVTSQPVDTPVGAESIDVKALAAQLLQPLRVESNGFYGLADAEEMTQAGEEHVVQAVIHDTQEVVAGATVKMRLAQAVYVDDVRIPAGTLVYGVCGIQGERLTIDIQSIRYDQKLYPVALSVYDLDGLPGIYIPGAITRDAAKQAAGQSVQDINLYSMDDSFGMQAATAGVQAAKGLFGKKARLVKVTLTAGYQILLQGANS